MMSIIEKHIGKKEYQLAINPLADNKEFIEVFTTYLKHFLTELEGDNAIEENDTPESLLEIPLKFIEYYTQSRQQGFSKVWSNFYADRKILGQNRYFLEFCYSEVAEGSEEEALQDLRVFCKNRNADKLYTDYLIDRIIQGNGFTEEPIEQVAEEYTKIFKDQINKGQSKIYAHQYADLMVDNFYHPIYCKEYALAYEQSICNGKSEEYAKIYATALASELVDVKRRAGISDDEESLDFAESKAIAYINGWEYATDNKLEDLHLFIKCYSNAYLNTLYSENPNEWKSIDECENISLTKALKEYERRKKL